MDYKRTFKVALVIALLAPAAVRPASGQSKPSYPPWLTSWGDHHWYASRQADLPPQMGSIRRVYLAGSYLKAIHWASRNLRKKTCLRIVSNPNNADALLMLDPARDAVKEAVDKMYEYSCSTTDLSVSCTAPDGKEWTTRCVPTKGGDVYCTSGEDPLLETVGSALDKVPLLNPSVSSFRATFVRRDGRVIGGFTSMDSWGAGFDFRKACDCKKRRKGPAGR